jgi:uncharacterized membrane protein YeaQ/YmgE (transglycosylase-associated protein family)
MSITGIISAIVVGLIIGALGRLVVPGKQPIPIWLTLIIGIVAAFIGSALGYGNANGGIPWILIIIQVVVAAILVAITAGLYSRRGARR